MDDIWLLFDNGGYFTVECSLHDPLPGSSRPVDGFIISESRGDFVIAAQNATHAAYTGLKSKGVDLSPKVGGFGLAERINAATNIAGESGGLSFAIAFAKALLKMETPGIAATGVILSNGRIEAVSGLETKLKTAAGLVDENGLVFFPEANGYTLTEDLEQRFKEKNIQCHPVSHFDEVFDILKASSGSGRMAGGSPSKLAVAVIILLALLFSGAAAYQLYSAWEKKEPQAKKTEPAATSISSAVEVPATESLEEKAQVEEKTPIEQKTSARQKVPEDQEQKAAGAGTEDSKELKPSAETAKDESGEEALETVAQESEAAPDDAGTKSLQAEPMTELTDEYIDSTMKSLENLEDEVLGSRDAPEPADSYPSTPDWDSSYSDPYTTMAPESEYPGPQGLPDTGPGDPMDIHPYDRPLPGFMDSHPYDRPLPGFMAPPERPLPPHNPGMLHPNAPPGALPHPMPGPGRH